jgi:excisionase family DNA binding protein
VASARSDDAGKHRRAVIDPSERRLVGLSEAGAMLGVSRSRAHQLVVSGELEGVRLGRRLLVTVESIDALVARLREEAAS